MRIQNTNVETYCNTSLRKKKSAFTLVELIIVITILAILATIGFISFQSYTLDARDANRITSLKTMSDGLQIYEAKKSVLPIPDEQIVNIMSGTNLISIQGYAGTSVLQKLKASDIKDPSDNSYYTYIVNSDKTKYQLLSMLEKDSSLAMNNNLLNEAYALTDYVSRYAYTIGNKVGVFFSGSTNNTPIQKTMSGDLDLTTGVNATKLFKVIFSNSTSASGTITATGLELPEIIQTETNSIATESVQTLPSPINIYGDEDATAIRACNKWITDNIGTTGGIWVWVPARNFITDGNGLGMDNTYYKRRVTYNGINYICNGFAIMKYEAKNVSSIPKSQALLTPWVSISQGLSTGNTNGGAIKACKDILTTGWTVSDPTKSPHLITNNERMATARNIEQQAVNWSAGAVGNGGLYRGNNTDGTVGTLDCNDANPATGASDNTSLSSTRTTCVDKRQNKLSNGGLVHDLAGNVREHVNKGNTIDGTNFDSASISVSQACTNGYNWYSWYGTDVAGSIVACNFTNSYTKDKYGPSGNRNADNGMGRIYSYNTANNVFLRSDSRAYDASSGLFGLYLNWHAAHTGVGGGFRCAW